MKWMFRMPILLFVTTASAAYAEPWLCTDENGYKAFSYDPASATDKRCVHRPIPSTNYVRVNPHWSPRPPQSAGDFPRVSPETQRERDLVRRQILERELAEENRLLAAAAKELAAQKELLASKGSDRERLKPFEDRVRIHANNIANLERELRNQKS